EWIWAFTTQRLPPISAARYTACSALYATPPFGTGTPKPTSSSFAWYSWMSIGQARVLAMVETGGRRAAMAAAIWTMFSAMRADGPQPVRPAGGDHARQGRMPLVARVVGVQPADAHGARAHARGEVGDAEVHRFEPAARLRDGLDVRHAQRGLDQHLDGDPVGDAAGRLDLPQQRVHQVHGGRNP